MCVYIYVYTCTCTIHTVHTDTHIDNLLSLVLGDVHIGLDLISLHWTINKDAHARESLSLLLSTVNSFLTFFCLGMGPHEIIHLYLHWCCDSFNLLSAARSRTVCFIAEFLVFRPLQPFCSFFYNVSWGTNARLLCRFVYYGKALWLFFFNKQMLLIVQYW